jgi:hypothetical protein
MGLGTACDLTQGFTLGCNSGYGGTKEFYVIQKKNVTAIDLLAQGGIIQGITKVATKVFYKWELVTQTAEVTQEKTVSRENGTSMVKQSIKFPVNYITTSVRNELELLNKNVVYVVTIDENGIGWLHGYDNGLTVTSIAAKYGVKFGDRNGFEIAIEGETKNFAYEVDENTLATLLTP